MPPPAADHRILVAEAFRVPAPFASLAVRSEEPAHAWQARAPYGRLHLLRVDGLPPPAVAALAAEGHARVRLEPFPDVAHARTSAAELAAAAPGVADLPGRIAAALRRTGVLGDDLAAYRASIATRIDYLAACGAGFHNDVARHWSRCLFWLLALDVDDVEFVAPHAGLRVALAPGDLLVFDQTLAHGLCRPADGGLARAESFDPQRHRAQVFLTGELPLSDAQWAALGSPWLPVEQQAQRGALDLLVASFDERSGAIQQLRALRNGMSRDVCHADLAGG